METGDWGYNTEKERDEAASISRIRILQLSDFSKKLKWAYFRRNIFDIYSCAYLILFIAGTFSL